MQAASEELATEVKVLRPEAERYLTGLDWPGNVRQLENTCRWLTVMASGSEIHLEDLPPELKQDAQEDQADSDWSALLKRWAERRLSAGDERILDVAVPRFEQIMIDTALKYSHGRRQDAARLLGWGRNTLTRKIKEYGGTAE
jgi:two-component system nitrogen regulation response regulator GlnG